MKKISFEDVLAFIGILFIIILAAGALFAPLYIIFKCLVGFYHLLIMLIDKI